MKIHDIILYEKEGSIAGQLGTAGGNTQGGAASALTALGGGNAPSQDPNVPADPNAPQSGGGFVSGAVTAAAAIAAYKKLKKPSVTGKAPATASAVYRTPEARVAYPAHVRYAAALEDLKVSKAATAAAETTYNKMKASYTAAQRSGKSIPFTMQQLDAAYTKVANLKAYTAELTKTAIPQLELEAKASLSAISNPLKKRATVNAVSKALTAEEKAVIEAKYMSKWSWTFKKALSLLGVIGPLIQLYAEYEYINSQPITPREKSAEKSKAWGVFEVQLGTLIVARMAEVRVVAWIVKFIQILAGTLGSTFTGGASLAVSLAGAAATDYLVNWLGTVEGRQFLTENIGWAIQHGGTFATEFWTVLSDVAKGISGQPAS